MSDIKKEKFTETKQGGPMKSNEKCTPIDKPKENNQTTKQNDPMPNKK